VSDPGPDERDPRVEQLVRQVDAREAAAAGGYVALDQVRGLCDAATVQWALAADVLLVDNRTRLDQESGAPRPFVLCRLNRHHPIVRRLTAW